MNLVERLFLWGGLLAVGAVGLIVVQALGVPIPYLSDHAGMVDSDEASQTGYGGLPPPELPDEEEEAGLLAELSSSEGASWTAPAGTRGGADAPAGEDGEADLEGPLPDKVVAALGRDPIVDKLKAGVDLRDAGQVLAFLMATFTEKGSKLGEEDLEFLFEALQEQEDFGLRNLLFAHLERIGGDSVTDGVLAFLADEKNPAAIGRALGVLRAQGDEKAVEGLVAYLAETKNRKLQDIAFKNLLGTKSDAAVDPLLSVLRTTENRSTKQYALAALTQLGGATGAEAVLSYAASSDPFERSIGTKSLRDIRSKEAVPVLADSLSSTNDTGLRQNVIRTLGRIGDSRAVSSVSQVALYGETRTIRYEAMKTLGQIGSADAIPALRTVVETDENAGMRRNASRTISYIEKQEARRIAREASRR